MKHGQFPLKHEFAVSIGNKRAQAAEMVLAPGDSTGGPDNSHRGSDQWLFVVSGSGVAMVDGKRVTLRSGKLLLIEKGENHEICNSGRTPLKTVNVYVPPAFTKGGNPLPRGKPK